MNSHSPAPSSGRSLTGLTAATRSSATAYMSERQTQAYLLSRDTVRRIRRTSSLVEATLRGAAESLEQPRDGWHQSH